MSKRLISILAGAIVLGLAIIIGVSTFVILPDLNPSRSSNSTTGTHHKKVSRTKALSVAVKRYGLRIKQQIAQALHLTANQLKKQLRSGKTLSAVATAQGVSLDQLTAIVHDAFTNGLEPAVTAGSVKQVQVDNLIKKYQTNEKALEVFLGAGKKAA